MRVFVLVNTLQSVSSFVYSNHINFFVKATKTRPDLEFMFFTPHRASIDQARNTAAEMALQSDCDYLMFIDDDVLVPPETLDILLKADKDIIAGLVIIRGFPFNNMAFKFREEEGEQHNLDFYNELPLKEPCEAGHEVYKIDCEFCIKTNKLQELIKVDAVGFSCCLIKCDVLQALEPPYFVTARNHTEDIYFCLKIRTLDPIPEIWLHSGVRCGHLLNPEPIEWGNRPLMKRIYDPIVLGQKEHNDKRDQDYFKHCLAAMK